ncbi:hypothetical protein MPSYJ_13190 [Mycolicibacterium psychrotolerans]|uniref:UspA domain-containing protein n=1 Tax=Mycolicibacterium psychrotolerans TaxID=216929 RepID=A0A7I7M6P5_9MYCO|nr:hypothetical protein MPSYJ_13190 [Mycolicibacterium psychrotolerans]
MTAPVFDKILVAVDDSPAALAAGHAAVHLAARTGARLRFVHVTGDGELVRALRRMGRDSELSTRRSKAAAALMAHVGAEAERADVIAETTVLEGDPAALVLAEATNWDADLIVMGRPDLRGPGHHPFVGTVTRKVLELAEIPVMVVPRPA